MTRELPKKVAKAASTLLKGRKKSDASRRDLLNSAVSPAGTVVTQASWPARAGAAKKPVDVLLIGGGIMSSTLGVLLHDLEPDWTIEMIERLDDVAAESSNGWNNAGTGHAALCELNYVPMDDQGDVHIDKAVAINERFQVSRQFWTYQLSRGVLQNPPSFINSTPHMSLVWGEDNVDYLRKRFEALKSCALFDGMEFSTDPAKIAEWAPLTMEGHDPGRPVAATWSPHGTDVNYGEITRQYVAHLHAQPQFKLHLSSEVRSIKRNDDGTWHVKFQSLNGGKGTQAIDARFVFIGAGGGALPLLQEAGIPEARDYAGFPVGGSFLISENPEVAARHQAKVYGRADVGAPPMSVPHLDSRVLDGKHVVLFGPFATFSTKFLKNGSYFELPSSVTRRNLWPMLSVGMHNFDLITYLAGQLMLTDKDRMAALRKFYPNARKQDWRLWQAGQRVQVIKRDPEKGGGVLKLGTEIVASQDGTISALLGASPGASTAAPIMFDLLAKVFPDRASSAEWQAKFKSIVPSFGLKLSEHPDLLDSELLATAKALQLSVLPVSSGPAAPSPTPRGQLQNVSDIAI
ncbi:MAG TPA: malate dehydrogenase (quinone) [Paenirhodobacter sp.]